jgi:phosphatidylethanolamine/phosphatidyl-N-methylethanolamine N-methyltransferase
MMASSRDRHEVNEFYQENYSKIFSCGSTGRIWEVIHKQMEKPYRGARSRKILEIGAGAGEHIRFVKDRFESYIQSDIDISNLPKIEGVSNEKQDATQLSYASNAFDRSILSCVLVHLYEPELAIAEVYRVTKEGGSITIYVPCEPGILLRYAQRIVTEQKMKKLGIANPRLLHFIEHRSNFFALDYFIREEMSKSKIQRRFYPFRIPIMNLNLYVIYQISVSKKHDKAV